MSILPPSPAIIKGTPLQGTHDSVITDAYGEYVVVDFHTCDPFMRRLYWLLKRDSWRYVIASKVHSELMLQYKCWFIRNLYASTDPEQDVYGVNGVDMKEVIERDDREATFKDDPSEYCFYGMMLSHELYVYRRIEESNDTDEEDSESDNSEQVEDQENRTPPRRNRRLKTTIASSNVKVVPRSRDADESPFNKYSYNMLRLFHDLLEEERDDEDMGYIKLIVQLVCCTCRHFAHSLKNSGRPTLLFEEDFIDDGVQAFQFLSWDPTIMSTNQDAMAPVLKVIRKVVASIKKMREQPQETPFQQRLDQAATLQAANLPANPPDINQYMAQEHRVTTYDDLKKQLFAMCNPGLRRLIASFHPTNQSRPDAAEEGYADALKKVSDFFVLVIDGCKWLSHNGSDFSNTVYEGVTLVNTLVSLPDPVDYEDVMKKQLICNTVRTIFDEVIDQKNKALARSSESNELPIDYNRDRRMTKPANNPYELVHSRGNKTGNKIDQLLSKNQTMDRIGTPAEFGTRGFNMTEYQKKWGNLQFVSATVLIHNLRTDRLMQAAAADEDKYTVSDLQLKRPKALLFCPAFNNELTGIQHPRMRQRALTLLQRGLAGIVTELSDPSSSNRNVLITHSKKESLKFITGSSTFVRNTSGRKRSKPSSPDDSESSDDEE